MLESVTDNWIARGHISSLDFTEFKYQKSVKFSEFYEARVFVRAAFEAFAKQ